MTATAPFSHPACPRCGTALPADAPGGLCPQCLLSDGFGAQSQPTGRFTGRIQPRFVPPTIEELAAEFPHLNFVRLLGSGGMGAVYLANQVRLARPVAVKILPPDLADDAAFAERFLREARALARLSHPNIVGVFDFGQTAGGLYYFLMEYIEGPTLRQVVANRSAEPKQALEIVRQVCDALQYAHDKGVVHRDIKPDNVLLDSHGRVKIADFGLAKLLGLAETAPGSPAAGSLTGTRQAMGTPHYMAPEQIMGSRNVDHRADIYSLGVVFYELLTGELPLGRFAPPSRKVQIDVRLDEVVLRTLEAEPEHRYQRAGDVKTDVETISSAPPPTNASTNGGAYATAVRSVRGARDGATETARTILGRAAAGDNTRKATTAWICVIVALMCVMLSIAAGAIGGIEAAFFAAVLFVWIGLGSAIAATALTFSAIGEIRRSEGRLTGLVRAVAVALVLPLAILDIAIWFVCLLPGFLFAENILRTGADDPALVITTLIAVPVALLADFCVLRSVWQWSTRGMSPELVKRELSVIPPDLQELGSKLAVFCDKVLRALKPIQRRHERHSTRPATLPSAYQRATPPHPPAALHEKPILYPADEPRLHDVETATPMSRDWASPRVSGKAIVGAVCLAAALPLTALCFVIANAFRDQTAAVLGVAIIFATVFAATILGWLAVGDICRSGGRLIGLPFAVFVGLLCPLLAIDAVLFALAGGLGLAMTKMGFYFSHRFGSDGNISLIAIPTGLVASVVVDVLILRTVWRRVRLQSTPDDSQPGDTSWDGSRSEGVSFVGSHRELIAAAAAIGVAALLVGIKAINESRFDETATPATIAPPPIAHAAANAEALAADDEGNHKWHLGARGPELGTYWSHISDPIPEQQQTQIENILQQSYADYERLLEEHTTASKSGSEVSFKIEPFPAELDRLTSEFWSRVDPLLNRDQQAAMRFNFPLRQGRDDRAMSSQNDGTGVLLLFGDRSGSISIERIGQWYHWNITNGFGWEQTTPELPALLAGWESRYERVLTWPTQELQTNLRSVPVIAPKPDFMSPIERF